MILALFYVVRAEEAEEKIPEVVVDDLQQIEKSDRISVHEEEKAEQAFFDTIDLNNNGRLNKEEIGRYIRKQIGGKHFDEETEISSGIQKVLATIDSSKGGNVSPEELDSHWSSIESFLTVGEVTDWVEKGLELPKYAEAFAQARITGFDFPSLLEQNGELLKTELGIQSTTARKRIMATINMKILGAGEGLGQPVLTAQPHQQLCATISLNWNPIGGIPPAHSYQLQRMGGHALDQGAGRWKDIYFGPSLSFTDTGLHHEGEYSYRLQAWSILGHSTYHTVERVRGSMYSYCIPLEKRSWLGYVLSFVYSIYSFGEGK